MADTHESDDGRYSLVKVGERRWQGDGDDGDQGHDDEQQAALQHRVRLPAIFQTAPAPPHAATVDVATAHRELHDKISHVKLQFETYSNTNLNLKTKLEK